MKSHKHKVSKGLGAAFKSGTIEPMTTQLQGVNLGGWLVLEKWLTPGIFASTDAKDEYSLSQTSGGKKLIETHRNTFITEQDFKWLHSKGIEFVRLPVGYWLFEQVDGYVPSVKHLDNAMRWAEKYGIQVLIDLHGARGSQNGFDSSGKMGEREWFTDASYRTHTLDVLRRIAERYRDSPALWGIELLNEPLSKGQYWTLLKFYRIAYSQLRATLRPGTHVVFHDSFRPLLFTGALWPRKHYPIVIDIHWYGFEYRTKKLSRYLGQSALVRRLLIRLLQLWQPVLIGEWSTVLPQRFFDDVPTNEHMKLLARNATMQQKAYSKTAGWTYWNYKAEGDGMWNFRDLVERGVIVLRPE